MTVFVDHTERRKLILERSFALFAREGFEGVTFQKIANECGIARTLIYRYFKDKEEIFLYAVRQGTDKMSAMVEKVMRRADLNSVEKLRRVLHLTIKMLSENRVFLSVVLDYLAIAEQSGANVRRRVRRYTWGMKFFIDRLLREAAGEQLLISTDPVKASGHLFCLLEAYVLNITIVNLMDRKEYITLIDNYLNEQLPDSLRSRELSGIQNFGIQKESS
ncbi:MAG: TetR/AcrR family transcriptional regulator [Planctomycetia bacterium]|nr:TetR/AcrR family transcriptional regulator [Planctomycetia bacterium]